VERAVASNASVIIDLHNVSDVELHVSQWKRNGKMYIKC
jgi:hypothetical protein